MPLEHAILSVLNQQPMSGYDLKKEIDQHIGHFWSTTQSHIYKSLRQLEEDGLVSVEEIQQANRPNRKVYSVTDTGRQELEEWLKTPMECDPVREAWLMQVYFAHPLDNEQIATLFEERIQKMKAQLDRYRRNTPRPADIDLLQMENERARELWQMTVDYGTAYLQFQIAWHERALQKIKALPVSHDDRGPNGNQAL
jgi:DNA-binding PadR family transcriptional regulator